MASIKHTSTSSNFRRDTIKLTGGLTDINSNITSNKYVHAACHIDLTSNSDLYETVIIDDEVDEERDKTVQDYSDISTGDIQNADQSTILIESAEEGEITYNNDDEICEITKKEKCKTRKRKRSVFVVNKGGVPNKNIKIRKIEKLVVSLSTNFEQDMPSSSSRLVYKYTTEGNVQNSHKKSLKKKKKKRIHSKLGDIQIKKISKKHCNCCKCVERKARSQELKRSVQRGRRGSVVVETKKQVKTRESPQVRNSPKLSADREAPSLLNVRNQDRPIPECRRSCSRAARNYIPKYLVYRDQQTEKNESGRLEEQLECISSDELNDSESHNSDSSFSLSDIENLISRTRKLTQNPFNLKIKEICHDLEQTPVNSEKIEIKKSNEIQQKKSSETDLSKATSSGNSHKVEPKVSEKKNLNENSQQKPLRNKLTMPIAKLLPPVYKVRENDNSENIEIKKCNESRRKKSSETDLSKATSSANSHKVELKESEKNNLNENSQQKPLRNKLTMPIAKLLPPVFKVRENDNENLSENKIAKPTDTTKSDKVKPNRRVKHRQQSEPKITSKEKSSKTTAQNKCLMLDLCVGSILNERYETREIVKRGSYSNIIRVMDRQNSDNIVLLKILHRKKYSHMLFNLKLLNGIDAVDKYHCVRLNGQFFVNSHLALWLEDYGCNLQQSLQRRSSGFPLTTVQHLGRQLLIAVQFLRECKVLHGNIRPEHILMGSNDSNLKLTGFDGAIARNNKVKTTSSERGPVNYQAPEIILNLKFGYSVDVWSAACVIYEMVAGKRLFSSITANQVLWQIMNLHGEFPDYMRAGQHFHEGVFILKHFNVDTGQEEWKPIRKIASKRNLKTELSLAHLDSNTPEEAECKRGARLVNLLSMALHSMLLAEPNRRIAVDFALLNQFFQITL